MNFYLGLIVLAGSVSVGVVNAQACAEGQRTCVDNFRISICVAGVLDVAKACGDFVDCDTSDIKNVRCRNTPFCITENGRGECSTTPKGFELSPGVVAAISALSGNGSNIQPNNGTVAISTTTSGDTAESTPTASSADSDSSATSTSVFSAGVIIQGTDSL
ncbi:hypothetical protein BB561_001144 [Smittium simulii]|uniref:Extracellular membrane protein CFEM domain-containing protein n=1 Tax=Smittium simulii TaxID=133385 RepID=A0A2T9YVV1_9FUNG|nr:hypothetical protein BB561_001144 [Smittium simulii]